MIKIKIGFIMLMNYSFNENFDYNDESASFDFVSSPTVSDYGKVNDGEVRIISEKIRIPNLKQHLIRPRLSEILGKFCEQFGTTLITGRAGTGKTTLAMNFADGYQQAAWFRVEASDFNWQTFSRYFLASFNEPLLEFINDIPKRESLEANVLQFLEILFSEIETISKNKSILIVLDDLHCVFDAEWFETFLKGLCSYDAPNVHILLLSRTTPPFPLWRLRSKQKLGVLDENLLLFTIEETKEFLKNYGVAEHKANLFHKASYGRISKILELSELILIHDTAD
ncbi:MAG: AAA family ATPase [Acidobacteria bacterium]|nr:AAA family ATPase [Acidobacteriota bacterium]